MTDLAQGAYVISDPNGKIDLIIMATGSELHVAAAAAKMLAEHGIGARVVSFPCHSFFEHQPREYKDKVLPPEVANRVAVEAGSPISWYRYVGPFGLVIGLERFGASAPYKVIAEQLGFTPEAVTDRILVYLDGREANPSLPTIEGAPGAI